MLASWLDRLLDDVDPCDPSARDPDLIHRFLPTLDWFSREYFEIEWEGEENAPRRGPLLVVANHSGGPLLPDLWMMVLRWWREAGLEVPAYALAHDFVFRIPALSSFLVRLGALRACQLSAERVISSGGVVLVYPGGEQEALRSFWSRNEIDFHGRTGFLKLALRHGVPILPVVNVGGHEVYLTLHSSRRLARWSGLERWTGIKSVPINLGLPWGLWLTGFVPYWPLPARISYRVGKPILFERRPELAEDPYTLQRAYHHVTGVMQSMLDELVSQRAEASD